MQNPLLLSASYRGEDCNVDENLGGFANKVVAAHTLLLSENRRYTWGREPKKSHKPENGMRQDEEFCMLSCACPLIFRDLQAQTGLESGLDRLVRQPRQASAAQPVFAPRFLPFGGYLAMEDQPADVSSSTTQTSLTQSSLTRRREGRGAWVLTAYCISGLALFGLLAYFFSEFIAH